LRRRRNRRPHAHQEPRRRPDPQHRQPHLQPPPPRPALPRRTRVRPAQRPLAHPPAHHRQPQQNRRHHPRRTRPHSFRARPPTRNSVRSTHCGALTIQLRPHLPRTINPPAGTFPHPPDLLLQPFVTHRTSRRGQLAFLRRPIRRGRTLQHRADRLDTELLPVSIDELD